MCDVQTSHYAQALKAGNRVYFAFVQPNGGSPLATKIKTAK